MMPQTTPAQDLVTAEAAHEVLRRLNVQVIGSGKPPLLFCNGFNCDQSVWRFVAPELAKQYQLILYDQVGVGKSDRAAGHTPRYATLAGYVQDVLDICQALALRDVVVVGHSAGALVAMLAAGQAPAHFAKVVLLAATPRCLNAPGYYGGFEERDVEEILTEMSNNYVAWVNTFSTMIIGQHQAPELSYDLIECATQADPEVAKRLVRLFFLSDYRAAVAQLQLPTLLLQCTDDPAVPVEVSRYLLAHLPYGTLVTLATSGHCPHLTAPAAVVAAVQQFLDTDHTAR
jgi:sigma-B regulation protein RsbQ